MAQEAHTYPLPDVCMVKEAHTYPFPNVCMAQGERSAALALGNALRNELSTLRRLDRIEQRAWAMQARDMCGDACVCGPPDCLWTRAQMVVI